MSLNCGERSSQNNTYLTLSAAELDEDDNPCCYTICPVDDDICRIRLDFRVSES